MCLLKPKPIPPSDQIVNGFKVVRIVGETYTPLWNKHEVISKEWIKAKEVKLKGYTSGFHFCPSVEVVKELLGHCYSYLEGKDPCMKIVEVEAKEVTFREADDKVFVSRYIRLKE